MNHNEVVIRIGLMAADRGIKWAYFPSSVRLLGHRGFPDMLLAGPGGIAFIEVKTSSAPDLSPGQSRWKWMLRASGQVHEIMFERDLEPGGAVDMMLSFLASEREAE